MISRLVELEQQRYSTLGYETIVTPCSIAINRTLKIINASNDTYILTGIRTSNNDMLDDANEVCISSPTDCIQATQQQLAMLGTSINRLFRNYIIVKTVGRDGYKPEEQTPLFRLDFIRISPIKKRKK